MLKKQEELKELIRDSYYEGAKSFRKHCKDKPNEWSYIMDDAVDYSNEIVDKLKEND
jgi:hypothetical protein